MSSKTGNRIIVVEITTAGFVPAIYVAYNIDPWTEKRRQIELWIRDYAMPADESLITTKQFHESGADVYLSVREQRGGGLQISSEWCHGKDYEYMAGEFVPKKYVTDVIPFDGEILHEEKPAEEIRSKGEKNFRWDDDVLRWVYDPVSGELKRERKGSEDDEIGYETGGHVEGGRPCKRLRQITLLSSSTTGGEPSTPEEISLRASAALALLRGTYYLASSMVSFPFLPCMQIVHAQLFPSSTEHASAQAIYHQVLIFSG